MTDSLSDKDKHGNLIVNKIDSLDESTIALISALFSQASMCAFISLRYISPNALTGGRHI